MGFQEHIRRWEPGIDKVFLYERESRTLKIMPSDGKANVPAHVVVPKIQPAPGTLSAPMKLFIGCTRRCDLDCPMCFARGRKYPQREMSFESIGHIVSQAAEMGVFEIRLTGGEPTVHPRFFDLVESMDEAGINVSINTHGAYDGRLLERIIDSPVDDIRISIDGPQEIHDSLRGEGVFARAINSVRAIKAAGKRVRINAMVFKGNVYVLEEMAGLAETLGVRIRFCPMRAIGRAREPSFARKNILSREEWHRIERALAERGLFKRGVSCFSLEDTEDFTQCEGMDAGLEECQCGPWLTQMGIDPEGETYSGGRIDDISKALSVGSVLEYPLVVLWKRAVQDVFDRVLPKFPNCSSCSPAAMWREWTEQLSKEPTHSRHLY
jgi:MoaA/NifB/PqqE/SkfB family radical SAM enzyme